MTLKSRPSAIVHNKADIKRSAVRFTYHIEDLNSLGFTLLDMFYDYAVDWAFLTSHRDVKSYELMRLMRDQVILCWPFTYAMICPALYQASSGTYAYICGMGCCLFTERAKDNLFVSASWPGNGFEIPEKGFFKRYTGNPTSTHIADIKEASDNPRSMRWFCSQHLSWAENSASLGNPKPASMEEFFRLKEIGDGHLITRSS
jgi:hypothetical protein